MAVETRHDPVLNKITLRIWKNIWRNCPRTESPNKEIRHELMIEHGVICNGDLIIPPETQIELVIKSVHDDIHCGVVATQKKNKIRSMVGRTFMRCWRIYKKMQKNVKN